ncbi:hypothetical protein DEJ23_14080 [Curtobacterium sp. MCSS17_008]|nr:hypothetical protein DEJ23_14080 [Curtobacterium sp. MCSS17_008]
MACFYKRMRLHKQDIDRNDPQYEGQSTDAAAFTWDSADQDELAASLLDTQGMHRFIETSPR